MTYIGFITIRDRFCNFYPVAVVNSAVAGSGAKEINEAVAGSAMNSAAAAINKDAADSGVNDQQIVERLDTEHRYDLFPKYANMEIVFARNSVIEPEDVFQNGMLYVLEMDDASIQENVNAVGDLKRTEKKVNYADLTMHPASTAKFFPVIEVDDRNSALSCLGDADEASVMLWEKTKTELEKRQLIGPVRIKRSGDEITIDDKRGNFILDHFTIENPEDRYYLSTDYAKDIPIRRYVDLNGLIPVKQDHITDEALLWELHRILRGWNTSNHIDQEEACIAEAAFAGLDIPAGILENRRKKITELFCRHKNIESLLAELSDTVLELFIDAAKYNSTKLNDFLSMLQNNALFRASVQSLTSSVEGQSTAEIDQRREELAALNKGIQDAKKRMAKLKKGSIDEQIEAARKRVCDIEKELTEAEAELSRLKLLRDEEAMKELISAIADSGRSLDDIIAVVKGLDKVAGE